MDDRFETERPEGLVGHVIQSSLQRCLGRRER